MAFFDLLFGGIWLLVSGIVTFVFYSAGSVNVNGVPVSHEEFVTLLWPKLVLGLFWAVGIAFFIPGIKLLLKDRKTKKYGEETYGVITRIYPSNVTVNGRPVLRAKVSAYIPSENRVEEFSEEIGVDGNAKYSVGSYVKAKVYNNDINIGEYIDSTLIPTYIYEELKEIEKSVTPSGNGSFDWSNLGENVTTADEIMINGVKYKRMD